MKRIPILLLTLTAAAADDCALLPGHPLITVDHPDPLANLPVCDVSGTVTTITLQAPTRFDWEVFQVNAGNSLVIAGGGAAPHASFHNVTTAAPAVISGRVTADGPFTLQQAAGGTIIVSQDGRITAPAITLTTQRAADSLNYLRTGEGRFDQVPGGSPLLRIEGNLRATGGALQLIGSRLVQISPHGKLEAPGRKVSVLAGPNASSAGGSLTAAELTDSDNSVIQHLGIARGFRVEMHAVPDYDAALCPLGFCGGQPGLFLGGEITATEVKLDTTHPLDPSVRSDIYGSLTNVSPAVSPGLEVRTGSFQIQNLGDPIDDDPPVIPNPVKLPGLETGVPATSQPLTVTYSHLNAVKPARRSTPAPAAGRALAVRGTTAKSSKAAAKPVVRGSFFGVPVKGK